MGKGLNRGSLVSHAVQAACGELSEAQRAYEGLNVETGDNDPQLHERDRVVLAAADRRNKAIFAIKRASITTVDDGFRLLAALMQISPALGGDPRLLAAVYDVAEKMSALYAADHEKSNGSRGRQHLSKREDRPQRFSPLSALTRLMSDSRRPAP